MKRLSAVLSVLCLSLFFVFSGTALGREIQASDIQLGSAGGSLNSGYYYLAGDVDLESGILIPDGATVSIDLNGHVLRGTGEGSTIQVGTWSAHDCSLSIVDSGSYGVICGGMDDYGGGALSIYGSCTLKGGEISGNRASSGGAVRVYRYGSFIMDAGLICDNTAVDGGAVYLSGYGSAFYMNGGTIKANIASGKGGAVHIGEHGFAYIKAGTICDNAATSSGAGIYLGDDAGQLEISGGKISGNYGAGVSAYAHVALGGTAVISGNAGANLYLGASAGKLEILGGADAPKKGMSVGLLSEENTYPLVITEDYGDKGLAAYFSLENSDGGLVEEAGATGSQHLVIRDTHTVSLVSNGFGSCEDSIEVLDGYPMSSPSIQLYDGYGFLGWYDDPELSQPHDFSKAVSADITLYASAFTLQTQKLNVIVSSNLFPGKDIKLKFDWSPLLYTLQDSGYDERIALAALLTIIDVNNAGLVKPVNSEISTYSGYDVLLSAMGFNTIQFSDVVSKNGLDANDCTSIVIAKQNIDANTAILNLSINGTNGANEWDSNMDVGADLDKYYAITGEHPEWVDKNNHKGFEVAANRVIALLQDYVDKNLDPEVTTLHVMINGYSRGAAIANIIGAKAEDGTLDLGQNLDTSFRTYTFATPNSTYAQNASSYRNIYNLCNADDVVTAIPTNSMGMRRYGSDVVRGIRGSELESVFKNLMGTDYQKSSFKPSSLMAALDDLCVDRSKYYDCSDEGYSVSIWAGIDQSSAQQKKNEIIASLDGLGCNGMYEIQGVSKEGGSYYVDYRISQAFIIKMLSNVLASVRSGNINYLELLDYVNYLNCDRCSGLMGQIFSIDFESIKNAHYPVPYLLFASNGLQNDEDTQAKQPDSNNNDADSGISGDKNENASAANNNEAVLSTVPSASNAAISNELGSNTGNSKDASLEATAAINNTEENDKDYSLLWLLGGAAVLGLGGGGTLLLRRRLF